MKKLMIMAAVAASVGLCSAAQANWTYYTGSDDDGLTVYALTGSPATFKSAAALIGASVGSAIVEEDIDPDYYASGVAVSELLTKTSAPAYFAIINSESTQYKVTSAMDLTSKVYDPAAQESSPGAYEFYSTDFGAFKDFEKDPEPTPEPTSAMLMLLGMAGLALKRKRA